MKIINEESIEIKLECYNILCIVSLTHKNYLEDFGENLMTFSNSYETGVTSAPHIKIDLYRIYISL